MEYSRKDVEKTKKIAKKFAEGRKTGTDFLSYENYNVDVEE